MKKTLILLVILTVCSFFAYSQRKIELQPHKPVSMQVRLLDEAKADDNFVMNLPLTLTLVDNNVLFVMVGNDTALSYGQTVWMFSQEMSLTELLKNDLNVKVPKTFEKQYPTLNPVLVKQRNMRMFRNFDDGYDVVKKNAKPIFLEIVTLPSNNQMRFSLQFYVAKPNNLSNLLGTKCKPVDIEIEIK